MSYPEAERCCVMEPCSINSRIASTLGVWNIESHPCILISFVACKYLTIDWTGRQTWFEPMRMKRIIDTPCHQLAVQTRRPTSWVESYDASQIYRRRMGCGQGPEMEFPALSLRRTRPREALWYIFLQSLDIVSLLGSSAWETSVEIAWPSLMTIGLSLAVISLVIGCLEALMNPSLCKFGNLPPLPPPPEVPPVESSSSGKYLPNWLAGGYHIAVGGEDRGPTIKLS